MKSLLRELGSGFLIGIANIIPGVSGGTFLLILGMYQRVMSAISGLNVPVVRELLDHALRAVSSREKKMHLASLVDLLGQKDIFFLLKIAAGAGIAIVVLSDVMMYLLSQQFAATYAFFFGLIIVSTVLSLRMVGTFTFGRTVMLILGLMVTVGITMAVNPADKAKTKSDHYRQRYEQQRSGAPQTTESGDAAGSLFAGVYTPGEYIGATLAGALGVSAMVLPGISGSLVLILVGQYHKVLGAISSLRTLKLDYLLFLMCVAGGMAIGVLLFARLVTFVFKRFYAGTIAFLTGLMAGSLFTLWPFKSMVIFDQYVKTAEGITLLKNVAVRTNVNIFPSSITELAIAVIFCLAGSGIMMVLGRYSGE